MEKSEDSARLRKAMHDAIDQRDMDKVEKCLNDNKEFRQWLSPETGKSALYNALEKGELQICAFLVSRKCTFNEEKKEKEEQSFSVLNRMQNSEYRYQLRSIVYKRDHIKYLTSISASMPSCAVSETGVEEIYRKLGETQMVDVILRVVATTPSLEVIFDFDNQDLRCMLGPNYDTTYGLTYIEGQRIYVGANKTKNELLGTVAHEFCHLALAIVYLNGGKPYGRDDTERRNHYERILSEIKSKSELHDVIAKAFQHPVVEEKELAVRVPHMLAMHSEECESGEALLLDQVPELFMFYKEFVIPDMELYTKKNFPENDRQQIREQNRSYGATELEQLEIQFKTKFDLPDKSLLVLTGAKLCFLAVRIDEALRTKGVSYVLLETKQWDNKLYEVLSDNKCHYVVLKSDKEFDMKKRLRTEAQEFLQELNKVRGTKVIVLTENDEQDQFAMEIKECFKDNAQVARASNCGLADVTDECKDAVLKKSALLLQERKQYFDDLTTSGDKNTSATTVEQTRRAFYKLLEETAFLKLCRDGEIEIGPKLRSLDEDSATCYVERTCKRATRVDLSGALTNITNEALAIVGCRGEELDALLPPGFHACHHSRVEQFERCLLLDSTSDCDSLVQSTIYEGKTIHVVQYDSQRREFHWVKSNGSLKQLLRVVSGASEIGLTNTFPLDIPDKVAVVCGDPGMGKSLASLRMAQDIKTLKEATWVLYVDLPQNVGSLPECASMDMCQERGESLLAALCGLKEATFEFNLLKSSISTAWPFTVVVIFDGFDEVDAENRKCVIKLVHALRATKILKVFVFSRNCCKTELEDKFHTIAFEINGFKQEEQLQFLKRLWKRNGPDIDEQNLESVARGLLNRFWLHGTDGITENPLYLKMIAEVDELRLELLDCISILYVYEEFVEKKFRIYLKKTTQESPKLAVAKDIEDALRSAFYRRHRLLALKVLFNTKSLNDFLKISELEELEVAINLVVDGGVKQGIVDGHNNHIPVFVHNTFAEFFAARFFFGKIVDKDSDVIIFVSDMYGKEDYDGILKFLDAFGAKLHALNRQVMNNDWQSIEDVAHLSYEKDEFSRSPLHIAALYANENTLATVARVQGEETAEELLRKDHLGMTPLMYADRKRALQSLNLFCALCSKKIVNLTNQLPVAVGNIRNESDFASSVIGDAMRMGLTDLLKCLLKECCVWKNAEDWLTSHPQETRHGPVTELPVLVDIDQITCDLKHTPIIHATSYEVFKSVLPYSSLGVQQEKTWDNSESRSTAPSSVVKVSYTLLHMYAAVGAQDLCKNVLCLFPSDACNANGQKPLHVGTISRNLDIVTTLIPHSTTAGARDKCGNTPLHLAVDLSSLFELESLCEWQLAHTLYKQSATPSDITDSELRTEVARSVLPHVDVTTRNCNGNTALHECSYNGFWSSVMLLLPFSDANEANDGGQTPFLRSISERPSSYALSAALSRGGQRDTSKGDIKGLKLLILHSRVDVTDGEGRTALHHCALNGKLRATPLLVPHVSANVQERKERKHKSGKCALQYGALNGGRDNVKILLPNSYANAIDAANGTLSHTHFVGERESERLVLRAPQTALRQFAAGNITDKYGGTRHTYSNERNRSLYLKVARLSKQLVGNMKQAPQPRGSAESSTKSNVFGKDDIETAELLLLYSLDKSSHEIDRAALHLCADEVGRLDVMKIIFPHFPPNITDKGGLTSLHVAAATGHLSVVNFLISSVRDNARDNFGRTPLAYSAFYGHIAVGKVLLPLTLTNAPDVDGRIAMHCCAQEGYTDIVELLLPHSSASTSDKHGITPLHHSAAKVGLAKATQVILPHSDALIRDDDGDSALFASAYGRCFDVAKLLVPYSEVNARNQCGHTALMYKLARLPSHQPGDGTHGNGITTEDIKIVKLLLLYSDVNIAFEDRRTALHLCAGKVGRLDVMKMIFAHFPANITDKRGLTSLHVAALTGHLSVAKFLISRVRVNAQDNFGRTPLAYSALYGHIAVGKVLLPLTLTNAHDVDGRIAMHCCAQEGYTDIVELLLPHSSASTSDKHGITPLHHSAAKVGLAKATQVILPHSDALIRDDDGDSALFASAYGRCFDVAKLLVPYSEVNARNQCGHTALMYKLARLPSHQPGDGTHGNGITTEDIKIVKLLLLYSDVNIAFEDRRTALHLCAGKVGRLDVMKMIFAHFPANITDKRGLTSLHVAALTGHLSVVNFLISRVRVNAQDNFGRTPLAYSALLGHIAVGKVLLPLTLTNAPGVVDERIAMHCCAQEGYTDIVELLLPHSSAFTGDKHGLTPLHFSVLKVGLAKATKVILPHSDALIRNSHGESALLVSAYVKRCDALILMLPYSDVNATNKAGMTSLSYILRKDIQQVGEQQTNATRSGEESSEVGIEDSIEKDIKMTKLLLLHSDVNVADNQKRTLLHLSVALGRLDLMKLSLPHFNVRSLRFKTIHVNVEEMLSRWVQIE
ncbi:uncharacterized protein LOC135366470 [Ornithodoros turicata]|uniref:uncharacterized protein LOC135366470 n=1 Tax=Ornithodoros turicata TaxID=34597 RepID=UPI00313902BB